MRCEFASLCRYYQSAGHTCNDGEEASVYCGAHVAFEEYRTERMNKA